MVRGPKAKDFSGSELWKTSWSERAASVPRIPRCGAASASLQQRRPRWLGQIPKSQVGIKGIVKKTPASSLHKPTETLVVAFSFVVHRMELSFTSWWFDPHGKELVGPPHLRRFLLPA